MSVSQNYSPISPSLSLDFANVKALDSRVTFARASGAVYYGTETAKAEENLLLRSQEFDNASWAKNGATATANTTTAPDGTTTAETLTCTASTTWNIFQGFTPISGQTYTYSIFAKADTTDFVQISTSAASRFANFDLLNGVVGTTGADATSQIIDIGNGWYRCSMVATGGLHFYVTVTGSSSAAHQTSSLGSVFLWGAQLEQRSFVTAYTPTTDQPITRFQPVLESEPANVARFDHNPVTGESLGLLVEEQRTNLFVRSEEFDNAAWVKTNATVSANQVVAPDGTLTGDVIVETTANGVHACSQTPTASASTPYTISAYFNRGSNSRNGYIQANNNGGGTGGAVFASFDLDAGTASAVTDLVAGFTSKIAKITHVGGNWYRCELTFTTVQSTTFLAIFTGVYNGARSYTGDGYSGIYIWGASLEQGSFSTSYTKTVASQVTRAADSASMVGANFSEWYRADEGTLYGEFVEAFNSVQFASNSGGLSLNTNSTLPIIEIMPKQTVIDFNARGVGAGATSGVALPSPASFRPAGTVSRVALTYITDPLGTVTAGSLNGTVATNATKTANSMTGINQLEIGKQVISGVTIGTRYFRKVSYYPIAVTSAQLQALTS